MTGTTVHNRIRGLSCMVGNTPLMTIEFEFQGRQRTIYAKKSSGFISEN